MQAVAAGRTEAAVREIPLEQETRLYRQGLEGKKARRKEKRKGILALTEPVPQVLPQQEQEREGWERYRSPKKKEIEQLRRVQSGKRRTAR